MSARNLELARQRDALVAQIVIERAELARNGASLRVAARMIDNILDGIQYFRSHPEALLLPIAIVVVWRPRRLLAIAVSAFGLWRLVQNWRRQILS